MLILSSSITNARLTLKDFMNDSLPATLGLKYELHCCLRNFFAIDMPHCMQTLLALSAFAMGEFLCAGRERVC